MSTKSFCDLVPLELDPMVSIASARTQVSTTRALRDRASECCACALTTIAHSRTR
jgi:hypothetical protein